MLYVVVVYAILGLRLGSAPHIYVLKRLPSLSILEIHIYINHLAHTLVVKLVKNAPKITEKPYSLPFWTT